MHGKDNEETRGIVKIRKKKLPERKKKDVKSW